MPSEEIQKFKELYDAACEREQDVLRTRMELGSGTICGHPWRSESCAALNRMAAAAAASARKFEEGVAAVAARHNIKPRERPQSCLASSLFEAIAEALGAKVVNHDPLS